MNEFDLIGPQFLTYYVPATIGTIFGAFALRAIFKVKPGEYKDLDMTAYDAAYLSGGEQRIVDAAVAKLLVSQVLTVGISPPSIEAQGDLPGDADPVERLIYQSIKNHSISNVRDIYKYVTPSSQSIRPKLIEAGLILDDARTTAIRVICTLMTIIPVVFWGAPKLILGLSRHKPVTYLLLTCVAGVACALWFARQTFIRTARGDAAVTYLKDENKSLEYSLRYGGSSSSGDLAMATGLFGTAILLTSPLFAPMRTVFANPVGSSGSSSGCGSSGSSCGSSCGGGGCGGGCGGCGG